MMHRFSAPWAFGWLLALMLGVSAAQAQTHTATPGAIAAAKELIELKGASHMFDTVVPGVIQTAKNMFLRTSPNLAKDLNEVAELLRTEYAAKRNEILDELARTFAQRFTEKELRDAVTFYKTPLGRKLIENEGAAMEEGMSRVQNWANRFSEEVVGRLRAEMRKRGHNI